MTTRILVSLVALTTALAATAASAQSVGSETGAIKPAETIACELKGTCGEADVGLDASGVAEADSSDAVVCRLSPESCTDPEAGRSDDDRPGTRGFSLRVPKSPASRSPAVRSAAVTDSRNLAGAAASGAALRPRYGPGRISIGAGATTRVRNLALSQKRGTAPISSTRFTPGARSNLAVGFEYDSATLDAMGRAQAVELLKVLTGKDFLGKKVVVAGHTDSLGDREYNLELSRRRAQTLVEFLSGNGVDRTLLEAKGFGFDDPLPGSSPRDGVNRRVEVMLKL